MPPILRKLMRHANVPTTMQYYVDLAVDGMADDLWAKQRFWAKVTFPVTLPPNRPRAKKAEVTQPKALKRVAGQNKSGPLTGLLLIF